MSQLFERQQVNISIMEKLATACRQAWLRAVRISNTVWLSSETMTQLVLTFVYIAAAYWIGGGKMASAGVILAMTGYVSRFWQPITNLANIYNSFVNNIAYLERIFGTHIIRLQDGGLFSMVNALRFQWPHDEEWIDGMAWPEYDAQNIAATIRSHLGLPRAGTAYGLNASDSIDRMITVRQCHGRYNGTRSFYPNFDWTHTQIMETLRQSNIRLSNEYHIASRSFAGAPMPHTLMAIKRRDPGLFARLELYYPLLKASVCRTEWRNEKCLAQKPKQRKGQTASPESATPTCAESSAKTRRRKFSRKQTTGK